MIVLLNDTLKIELAELGAELQTLTHLKQEVQLLWQGHEALWARRAPVLFPIVGRLKNGGFRCQNQFYQMPQHGFARDCVFNLLYHTNTAAHFQLQYDSQTLTKFPFKFNLQIHYTLNGNELLTTYIVKNLGEITLPFSIGAHPGFKLPFFESERATDYFLEFNLPELELTALTEGLRKTERHRLHLPNKKLALSDALFANDALVFESQQIETIHLRSKNHNLSVQIDCPGWPYFGVWSKSGPLQFVCLEPWMGITDSVAATPDLLSKEGILLLPPHQEQKMLFRIVIND